MTNRWSILKHDKVVDKFTGAFVRVHITMKKQRNARESNKTLCNSLVKYKRETTNQRYRPVCTGTGTRTYIYVGTHTHIQTVSH